MSREDNFRYIYEDIKGFHRNLGKDNSDRRSNLEIIQKYISKLNRIKNEVNIEINEFQKESFHKVDTVELIKSYILKIQKYITAIDEILRDRLASCSATNSSEEINLSKDRENIVTYEMTEKFDLRTAAAIIPSMNSSQDTIKGLIDAIELYDSLLDNSGKKLLTTYVLKTRLTESAKLRLQKTYPSNEALITDIKSRLLTKKAAAALSLEMHNMKQNRTTIEQYGKSLEELMVNLTLAQSNGNDHAATVLTETNEIIAVNAFANGLYDNDLRVIIKARNYTKLKDAISAAQDEETSKRSNASHVFQLRGRGNQYRNFRNRSYRGNSNNFNRGSKNSYSTFKPALNANNNNFGRPNRGQGYYRGKNYERMSHRDSRNEKRGFHIQGETNDGEAGPSVSKADGKFFRPSL